ncbi:hypothetical protein PCANB_001078 [Pneumocystis canis]|nr:hypothetical protein PCK1_001086 [Pneumocystis canis]KAG5437285.1 hypothetical protein PCANB_001078 [Pneumocystis canis]
MLFDATSCIEPPILNIKSTICLNPYDSALFLSQYLQTQIISSSLHTNINGSFNTRMALQNAGTNAQLHKILQHLKTSVTTNTNSTTCNILDKLEQSSNDSVKRKRVKKEKKSKKNK